MGDRWRSMWMGTIAAIIIAMLAGVVMTEIELPSAQKFSTSSTRL